MFKIFREVKNEFDSHISSPNHIFDRDSYEEVLSKIKEPYSYYKFLLFLFLSHSFCLFYSY
jgi:hypothetical protein